MNETAAGPEGQIGVAVVGASGRMGRTLIRAIEERVGYRLARARGRLSLTRHPSPLP